jgi:hypothetical protein
VHVEFKDGKMVEVPGTEKEYKADLVLLAMGFVSPVATVLEGLASTKTRAATPRRTTEFTGGYATNVPKVFAAGDIRRGQSPGGLGHPRRPPGRPLGGRVPDGLQRPATLKVQQGRLRPVSGFTLSHIIPQKPTSRPAFFVHDACPLQRPLSSNLPTCPSGTGSASSWTR